MQDGTSCYDSAVDTILKKLQVKGTNSLKLFNKPPHVKIATVRGQGTKVVLMFAKDKKELMRCLSAASRHADMLWVAYPKGSSNVGTDLNRDILASEMKKKGWESIALIAIDETWSAMRFKSV